MQTARFQIGQIVWHTLFNYRGVIYDIDPVFAASDEWYQRIAKTKPSKDQPWYKILVDGAEHTTYVAERNLEEDEDDSPIVHPQLDKYFRTYQHGRYQLKDLELQ